MAVRRDPLSWLSGLSKGVGAPQGLSPQLWDAWGGHRSQGTRVGFGLGLGQHVAGLCTPAVGARPPTSCHACLPPQVPQDEWSGYPAGKDGEIPCRRMRSGSYIKAMGDEDSADSDISAKVLPRAATRRDSYRRSSSADQARTK